MATIIEDEFDDLTMVVNLGAFYHVSLGLRAL